MDRWVRMIGGVYGREIRETGNEKREKGRKRD